MGKFDLNDILSGDEQQPKSDDATPRNGTSTGHEDIGEAGSNPDAAPSSKPGSDAQGVPMFVRKNPEEVPRPPDLTGSGLGGELDASKASIEADPERLRPDDALTRSMLPDGPARNVCGLAPGEPTDLPSLLESRGCVTAEQIASAERVMKQTPGKRISMIFTEMGVDETDIQQAMADLNLLPFERIDPANPSSFDYKALSRLTNDFCKDSLVLPLRKEGARLVVGTVNPDDVFVLDDVRRKLGVASIKHVLVTSSDIRAVIEAMTESDVDEVDVDELLADVDEDDVEVVKEDDPTETEDAESSPVVRYVNHIIQTAMKEGASDIHLEPEEKTLKVRFRIDGVLFEMMSPPKKMHASLTSRIKIMSNLDIAERRLPQDGRIRATVLGRKLDLRVSTLPTAHGEKTVMRILDNRSISVGLDQLGFAPDTLTIWKHQVSQPHGIILVTGPTGSGKTTTLYSSIREMDLRKLNVSTVEDPVEYNLANITQVQTHDRIGMNFAAALKSLLRQDPDVIMVGEIRDIETATIALQASMTGHLVLSTLHTNDAPASITRLINIGIEPFLVGAAVNGVLAQRLVRRICKHCSSEVEITEDKAGFLEVHGIQTAALREGKGCPRCRETGYSGRWGIYELLVLDDFIRDSVARNPNVTEFRRVCKERGMVTLREDGLAKAAQGITTIEEVMRVTESTI